MGPDFKAYQTQVVKNAQVLAAYLANHGMRIVSGGTDNHLMLVDLTPLGTTGKDAATALEKAGIIVNKNAVPFDPLPPAVTSGVRIGTPAVTTRGMEEADMEMLGGWIVGAIKNQTDEKKLAGIKAEVTAAAVRFPIP